MRFFLFFFSIALICGAQETLPSDFPAPEPISAEDLSLPPSPPPHKTPFVAVGLSYLFPGLGHVYLGDGKTAGGLMGAAGVSLGMVPLSIHDERWIEPNLVAIGSVWQYGIYAAYRDVRSYNQQSGYVYQMPRENFTDLLSAPFSFKVLKKPEVWGGFLGTLTAAAIFTHFLFPKDAHIHLSPSTQLERTLALSPAMAFPIGIGEEALFRGFFQSELCEGLGPRWGLFVTSLLFGLVHAPNAQLLPEEDRWRYYSFSLPLITAMGAYLGWMTQKNHSLRESVALHSWYDFTLFLGAALATQASSTTRSSHPAIFQIPIHF